MIIEVILVILFLLLGFYLIGGLICYLKLGMFRFIFHGVLGWHVPEENNSSFHSVCRYCGKNIIKDNLGMWYPEDEI